MNLDNLMRRASGEFSDSEEWLPKDHPDRIRYDREKERMMVRARRHRETINDLQSRLDRLPEGAPEAEHLRLILRAVDAVAAKVRQKIHDLENGPDESGEGGIYES